MAIEYLGLSAINGPMVVLEGVQDAAFDEIVEMTVEGREKKIGRIIEVYEDKAIIQVFEGTEGLALRNVHTRLTGRPMELAVSEDMLGRTFNGVGEPIDGLGDISSDIRLDVNGKPLNPVTREYPRDYIRTGISAIDGLMTLIRGQKLPIFSGNGLPHDDLAAQIVKQASLGDDAQSSEKFAVVFAAMGVKYDVADFFRRTFEESGVSDHVAMFINLANDPVVERLITPKVALTLAEYLAFEKGMHILVILTDMTAYAEALREVSSSKGEIPSRKGYPGYLYSELAAIYERAGMMQNMNGTEGSVTIIGAVSPQGGDFSEPVTQNTKRFVRCFWGLDRNLANERHFPAIHWLSSYSEYLTDLAPWYVEHVDKKFVDYRNRLVFLLTQESSLMEIVKLIGGDMLPDDQKLILEIAKVIRIGFLQQNAFHKDDTCVPMEKQFKMMDLILYLYKKSRSLVSMGMPMSVLKEDPIFDKIISIKYDVPNDRLDMFDDYRKQIDAFYESVIERNA